jgi:hypothetical protein
MSTRYKVIDKEAVYFTTSTVVGWCDVFTRDCYKTILFTALRNTFGGEIAQNMKLSNTKSID